MVSGANVSCACSRSPNGISPFCHLGDGCVDVLIIKHTNMLNNLRLLLRLSSKAKNVVRDLTCKHPQLLRTFKK
jgi:ceramide kinase